MTQKPNKKAWTHQPRDYAPAIPGIRENRGWVPWAAGAAVLAGSAIFNRASTRRAEAATPPAGSFIEVDGVRLHYVDRGSGPPVVLLHGHRQTKCTCW